MLFKLKSPVLTLFLRQFQNNKNIDYFNNKNKLLKYILSIWQISSEIGDLRLKYFIYNFICYSI